MFLFVAIWFMLIPSILVNSLPLRIEIQQLKGRLDLLEKTQVLKSVYQNTQIRQIFDILSALNSTRTDGYGDVAGMAMDDGKDTDEFKKAILDDLRKTVNSMEKETQEKMKNTVHGQMYTILQGLQQEKKLRIQSTENTEKMMDTCSSSIINIYDRLDVHEANTERLVEHGKEIESKLETELADKLVGINETVVQYGHDVLDIGARLNAVDNRTKAELHDIKDAVDSINAVLKTLPNMEIINKLRKQMPCPDDWIKNKQSCYQMFQEMVSFDVAVLKCASLNSHVTDVSSDQENDFLVTLVGNMCTWIGLTDSDTENVWKWHHSNAVTNYTKWGTNPGQQPDGGTNQNCVVINWDNLSEKQWWNDLECSNKVAYICKKLLE